MWAADRIHAVILLIRGQKVMMDVDLALLYGVSVGRLNEAVKRNIERFPEDFTLQLTMEEFKLLRSQFGTSSSMLSNSQNSSNLKSQIAISSFQWGGRRHPPYTFTEQGVAMLSSVLHSHQAIRVNIEIMRAFVRLRQFLAAHKELAHKVEELEKKHKTHDVKIKQIFGAIHELMTPLDPKPQRRIGFRQRQNEERASRSKKSLS